MKNLGRIFFIIFLFECFIHAGVIADVDATNVSEGDTVTYSLNLSGNKIQKPNIVSLCGEDITSTGSSTSIQSINGRYSKTYILTYKFIATKSCEIKPITLAIDGSTKTTKPINIVVSKFKPSSSDDFYLTLQSSKKEIYVGEPFKVTLTLKQKRKVRVVDSKFVSPSFSGFWIKATPAEQSVQDNEYITTKVTYSLSPQRTGTLSIDPAKISVASRVRKQDFWGGPFQDVRWKNYFSNELNIHVKALPGDAKLIGNFAIEAIVDKKEVNANEAINVTLKVTGKGNLEDVQTFKPYVNDVSIFDEDISINGDVLTQKITFVADSSFNIPSFSLEFFNLKTNKKEKIATNPIQIKVKNAKQKEDLEVKRNEQNIIKKEVIIQKTDDLMLVYAFLIGLFIGVLIMYLFGVKFKRKKEKKLDINDYKSLMIKFLPYVDNKDVKNIVDIMEKNSYTDEQDKIDKKVLKEIIKKYDIK